jgi:two-component sensor histidine kinase/CHASE1-domain containing sensor protein
MPSGVNADQPVRFLRSGAARYGLDHFEHIGWVLHDPSSPDMNLRRISGLASTPAGNIPRGLLALLALAGIALSLLMARIEMQQYRAIERLRIAEAVDANFSKVTDHLTARENLATIVAALFRPPALPAPRPLAQFGEKILALAPDATAVGWLPELAPVQAEQALQSMGASGIENPVLRGAGGKPIQVQALDRPLYPVLDVVPERARTIIGVDAGDYPNRLTAIRQARETRALSRTAPTGLVQEPDASALLVYAPVFAEDGAFLGVIGFGYKIDDFFRTALGTLRGDNRFAVTVFTHKAGQPLFAISSPDDSAAPAGEDRSATTIERKINFAGEELRFVYTVGRDLAREGLIHGAWVAAAGFCLTGAAILLLGFMASRAATLAQEVASRRSAEDRLKILIHELNHRVPNVMTVAQAVVRLSFTSGYSLADVQKTCEGRLQALSNAMTLLTASDWRSVGLRQLMSEEIIPFAERIELDGPDIFLRPRAAQTFSLLLYELATNAAKHGALSVPDGKVRLSWTIDRSGEEPVFRLNWRESGGPVVTTPTRRGFGELLVRRIAPRDVAGRSTVSYDSKGFHYELEAPLKELIDPKAAEKIV